MGKSALGRRHRETTQEASPVTGAGTDTVTVVMGGLGQVRRMLGSQDQSGHRQSSWKRKDTGERRGGRSRGWETREGPLPPHLMQYE